MPSSHSHVYLPGSGRCSERPSRPLAQSCCFSVAGQEIYPLYFGDKRFAPSVKIFGDPGRRSTSLQRNWGEDGKSPGAELCVDDQGHGVVTVGASIESACLCAVGLERLQRPSSSPRSLWRVSEKHRISDRPAERSPWSRSSPQRPEKLGLLSFKTQTVPPRTEIEKEDGPSGKYGVNSSVLILSDGIKTPV